MCADNVDMDLLISLVAEKPGIWDRSLEIYKDKNKTRDSWRQIYSVLNPDFEEMEESERKNYGNLVMRRWNNIRDSYMKWKNREKQAKKSGAGASKMKAYVYHDALAFLDKVKTHAKTSSSMEPACDDEGRSSTVEAVEDPATPDEARPSTSGGAEPSGPSTSEGAGSTLPGETSQKNVQNRGKKRKLDEFELKMLKVIEAPEPEGDRHLMFFKGILPSLSELTDTQTLEFQMSVLQIIRNIKTPSIQQQQGAFSQGSFSQGSFSQWASNPPSSGGNYFPPHHAASSYGYLHPPQTSAPPQQTSLLTVETPNESVHRAQNDSSESNSLYSPYSDTLQSI